MDANLELRILVGLLAHPQGDALDNVREWSEHCPWLVEPVLELQRITLEEWQGEHTRLFINGFPRTIAPPFLSVWNEGLMGGNGVGALQEVFREAGLEPVEGMPADYLGTLLEFLVYLQESSLAPGSMSGAVFKERFIQPWIQRFVTALREGSALQLYRSLADRLEMRLT
ncbi:MAG: molecular chaperone TorD family protein [Magnetococcales bacterium]|nr:molecular chaperone TorD family protein [Magnetococcales bacterium]